jgi:hypothetical protein
VRRGIADARLARRRRKVAAGSTTSPPPDHSGVYPPVGHPQFPLTLSQGQFPDSPRGHPCSRQCLLKGCERWFLPHHFQERYCSPACRMAARRWRRWYACQRYRATDHGKQRRRQQAQRRRDRQRLRSTLPQPPPPTPQSEPAAPPLDAGAPPLTDPPTTTVNPLCVGQRPAEIPENSLVRPCDRPGCYVLFPLTPRSPQQQFCSCSCRQALRRVRQREARFRKRRHRGGRARRPRLWAPP